MRSNRNETNALVVFLMGLGILVMVLGPCTGLYGIALGFIGLVASWAVAITLRVYHNGTPEDTDYWAYS
jgi:uncharacterized oligopeptide transporter (OPT) family protein